jgi:hypothetical protein
MRKIGLLPILLILFLTISCNNEATETKGNELVIDSTGMNNEKQVDTGSLSTKNSAGKNETADDEVNDDPAFVQKAKPLYWKDAGIIDSVGFKEFLKKLKMWVKNDERENVASVISFPMMHPGIASKEIFLDQYNTYFNSKVKKALENQKLSQLFRSNQGVMLTTGELWFKQTGDGFKITFINN